MTSKSTRQARAMASLFAAILVSAAFSQTSCDIEDCTTLGCEGSEVCDEKTGACVLPDVSCVDVGCPDDKICNPETGRCLDSGSFCLPPGLESCQEEDCSTCPDGQVCDTQSGFCIADGGCSYIECPRGEVCNPSTKECQTVSCGNDSECPAGSVCTNSLCQVGCREQNDCRDGEVCTGSTQAQLGNCHTSCTSHEECEWGEICVLQGSGLSSCELEPPCDSDNDCRSGETCRGETCRRSLCSVDDDCYVNEYCFTDTGECLSDDCVADQFEPNDNTNEARAILPGEFVGLTLCKGEEDWFLIQTPGQKAQQITILHAIDVDLDIEAYVDGRLAASAGSGRNTETIVLTGSESAEVALRIVPVRGQNAPYFLKVGDTDLECEEDSAEPNDIPAQATPLLPGQSLNFRVCPGDRDFVSASSASGGPLTLEGTFSNPRAAKLSLNLGAIATQEVPIDEAGAVSLSWVHLDSDTKAMLNATSTDQTVLSLLALGEAQACEDTSMGNQSPETPVTLDLQLDSQTESLPQAICGAGDVQSAALEEDWFALNIPEGALELNVEIENLSAASQWTPPALRATLMTGPDRRIWSGISAEAGGGSSLNVSLSRLDRPVMLRVDSRDGLPAILERWPSYRHRLMVSAADGCVQDRSEAGGNNELDRATTLSEAPLRALLCPGDVDVLQIDLSLVGTAPTISIEAIEGALDYIIEGQNMLDRVASGRLSVDEGQVHLMDLEIDPETARVFIILRATDETLPQGSAYTVSHQ